MSALLALALSAWLLGAVVVTRACAHAPGIPWAGRALIVAAWPLLSAWLCVRDLVDTWRNPDVFGRSAEAAFLAARSGDTFETSLHAGHRASLSNDGHTARAPLPVGPFTRHPIDDDDDDGRRLYRIDDAELDQLDDEHTAMLGCLMVLLGCEVPTTRAATDTHIFHVRPNLVREMRRLVSRYDDAEPAELPGEGP